MGSRFRDQCREMSAAKEDGAIRRQNREDGVSEPTISDERIEAIVEKAGTKGAAMLRAAGLVADIVAQVRADGVNVWINESRKHGIHIVAGNQRFYIDGTYDENYQKLPWTAELLKERIANKKGF